MPILIVLMFLLGIELNKDAFINLARNPKAVLIGMTGQILLLPAIAFGLAAPVRYIHCACNVAYLPDVEEVLKLARIVVKEAGELDV